MRARSRHHTRGCVVRVATRVERAGSSARNAGDGVVITTDTSVEGVHFKREWLNHFEIGYRATVASLSDLAAMGARPLGIVIALTLPEGDQREARELATGIREGASAVMCPIV